MPVLDKIKSFLKRREPEAKTQQTEPPKVVEEKAAEKKAGEGHETQGGA